MKRQTKAIYKALPDGYTEIDAPFYLLGELILSLDNTAVISGVLNIYLVVDTVHHGHIPIKIDRLWYKDLKSSDIYDELNHAINNVHHYDKDDDIIVKKFLLFDNEYKITFVGSESLKNIFYEKNNISLDGNYNCFIHSEVNEGEAETDALIYYLNDEVKAEIYSVIGEEYFSEVTASDKYMSYSDINEVIDKDILPEPLRSILKTKIVN